MTLRVYPRLFGKKVVELLPVLATKGEGKPLDSAIPAGVSATEAFAKAPWEDWPEANLRQVAKYLRGNKSLQLPAAWREVVPTKI